MRFKSTKSGLLPKIQFSASVINAKNIIPIMGNLLLALQGNTLTVSATNAVQSVECQIEVEGKSDGTCTVPAKKLLALLNSFADNSVVTVESDENNVLVSTENSSFSLLTLAPEDFPAVLPDMSKSEICEIPTEALSNMISVCSNAVCKDDARPMLTGMLLDFSDNMLTGVATDGKRMSIAENTEFTVSVAGKAVIPHPALALLSKLYGSNITVKFDEKNIMFCADKVTYSTKLISGNFPNYKAVIPQSYKNEFHFAALELVNAIKQITIVAEADQFIRLEFADNSVTISADNSGIGRGTITIEGDCQPDGKCAVSLNPKFLLDALANCGDDVTIKINDDTKPLCIERAENSYTILMPIRAK